MIFTLPPLFSAHWRYMNNSNYSRMRENKTVEYKLESVDLFPNSSYCACVSFPSSVLDSDKEMSTPQDFWKCKRFHTLPGINVFLYPIRRLIMYPKHSFNCPLWLLIIFQRLSWTRYFKYLTREKYFLPNESIKSNKIIHKKGKKIIYTNNICM